MEYTEKLESNAYLHNTSETIINDSESVGHKMAITIAVDGDYGYVILVGVASLIMAFLLGTYVFFSRKTYNVPYPTMYSDKCDQFNCIQRIHGNYLENLPTFLVLLFCGGLANPVYSAIAGVIYLIGKVVYSLGYNTGTPEKRLFGLFSYFGLVYLLYSTCTLAFGLLGVI